MHAWTFRIALFGFFAIAYSGATGQTPPAAELKKEGAGKAAMMKPLPLDEALVKARVNNKYEMLLRQIKVEKDADPTKPVIDQGIRDMREYAGHTDLPKGHWVYVYPYWYIWQDSTATPKVRRDWGPEQVIGEPDTTGPGDIVTAWASRDPDSQPEWLLCEYGQPVVPTAVMIYETYNPGAVNKVSVFKLDGSEVEVWKGEDPTPPDNGHGVSVIPIKVDFKVNRVKIYINSPEFPGWNEIDAVGLKDTADKTQWATAVAASTTYAQQNPGVPPPVVGVPDPLLMQRVQKLEAELKEVRQMMDDVRKSMKESQAELKELLKKKE